MANFRLMLKLERDKRNSIWGYILKNAYRPAFLRRDKVDFLVGNPPWLSYRYIKHPGYQKRVKELVFEYELLDRTDMKLFTQMDTSTLFFVHCSQEFLKDGGTISFVMPKSVIVPAKQHARFQEIGFSEVHDFTEVEPLFNVRTCLLVRGADARKSHIPSFNWRDKLDRPNASLKEAKKTLACEENKFDFIIAGEPLSPYYSQFVQGATLVPHCLWFVEPPADRPLNLDAPYLETSAEAHAGAKDNWRLKVQGIVEKEFLFGTMLAKDLIPFVVRKLSLVILPVTVDKDGTLRMANAGAILGEGHVEANKWVEKAEGIWNKRSESDQTPYERLDYNRLLTSQNPKASFVVLYNKSGTNLSAALLTPAETKRVGRLPICGFIADHTSYRYYATTEDEAFFLIGVLNSHVVNDIIKPFQSQGLYGERDIHRRPFEACPIPKFDPQDKLHQEIAGLSHRCRDELLPIVPKMQTPVARARADARHLVADKLAQLDGLVRELLKSTLPLKPKGKSKDVDQHSLL